MQTQQASNYRFCQYVPSLYSPGESYNFAVVLASKKEIVILGIDVFESYTLPSETAESVFGLSGRQYFEAVYFRIQKILDSEKCDGMKAVELLDNKHPTNLRIGSMETVRIDTMMSCLIEEALKLLSHKPDELLFLRTIKIETPNEQK